ncbi:homeobox-leucine zipper protein HOX32-like [Zingiber officinale]|uniref:homeobox-leucine zipper protein HOX32-like n=1 Tax=Zingiber officinale TaxID=94328 RepID=UPI001C4C14F0|nr:homeobox-leucine zipper protein HOX32-like [Zingiber officinale]
MEMELVESGKEARKGHQEEAVMDAGKYVRYTPEQVEALERVYSECPKPSSLRRQQLIRECPILSHIEPKQIKVWFQNRRCREKQRKESFRLLTVNRKLSAMNKLLMEENDRLQKQVSELVYQNGHMCQQVQNASVTTRNTSCESVITSGQFHHQQNLTAQPPQRDANNPTSLLAIAEETLAEFLAKATGTAVNWVQMVGMKPGPDSIGIVAVSHNSIGVAARTCGLVSLEPTRVAEILKDRPSWYRDCRCLDVLSVVPTGNGGNIELIYMQAYAPTTLAVARDFWTLRYTTALEDGSLVTCERSLTPATGGPAGPSAPSFVRGQVLPSGFLIRPCDGGGSMIHIVDHIDLDACSVPEVLRPLYESSTFLAQKLTLAALRHLRQISFEASADVQCRSQQPSVLRILMQRLNRGFNDAVNSFADDGWSLLGSDGVDDVTIAVDSSLNRIIGSHSNSSAMFSTIGSGILCAKASMLLQNVPPAILVRFLREHRSEWADCAVDAYSAASLRGCTYSIPTVRVNSGLLGNQAILPLAHTIEHEESLEVVKIEGHCFNQDVNLSSRDMTLLQLCSGIEENAIGACAQLVFAPIDESFTDDVPLLPSGFRVIPLEPKSDSSAPSRTLDLASTLETGSGAAPRSTNETASTAYNLRSVLTIAFQFTFENHLRDNVAAMARQYVRSVVSSVQRVAMAISPTPGFQIGSKILPPGSPEANTLAQWIFRSYRAQTGAALLQIDSQANDSLLKMLWQCSDAIMCCSLKTSPVFTFSNQAGLDLLETTLIALQDIMLENILDDSARKMLCSEFPKIMQQGFAYLPGGVCLSSMGRPVSYEQAVAWKVLNEEGSTHCLAFMFVNWSFV